MTAVLEERFPVAVTLADGSRLPRTKTFLVESDTSLRLLVFTAPASPVLDTEWSPAGSTIAGRTEPWHLATPAGVVTVHPGQGCKCGALGRWSPPGLAGERRRVGALRRVMRQAQQEQAS